MKNFNLQLFAAPGTTLKDVIVPELFNPYVIQKTSELSALVQCGIITTDAEFDRLASQAAPTVNMPFFADLTGESEQIIEGDDLDAAKIESKKDVAAIIRRAKMWAATDLAAALAGTDPMAAIASLVASFWARDMQKELIAILDGIFGTYKGTITVPAVESEDGKEEKPATQEDADITPLKTNLLDISGNKGSGAVWSASAFIDAQQLLGDAQAQLTAIAMHSATWSALKKQNLITTEHPSVDVSFDTYQGKRVIIDDGCPVTPDGVYTSYLFGQGAIALGNGSPAGFTATEIDRDKKKGSGVDYLINRKTMIMHPRGVKFTNAKVEKTEGPSRAELRDAENWQPVYEPKQIRIVAFKHKI